MFMTKEGLGWIVSKWMLLSRISVFTAPLALVQQLREMARHDDEMSKGFNFKTVL